MLQSTNKPKYFRFNLESNTLIIDIHNDRSPIVLHNEKKLMMQPTVVKIDIEKGFAKDV